jgi:hypothetical protein
VVVDELLARGLSVRVLDYLAHRSAPSFFLAWAIHGSSWCAAMCANPRRAGAYCGTSAHSFISWRSSAIRSALVSLSSRRNQLDAKTALVDEAKAAGVDTVALERLQCRTIDPLSVPELTPVAWIAVLCNVKVPVVAAKRPVPPVIV